MYSVKAVVCKKIEIPRSLMLLIGSITFAVLITIGAFVYIPLPFTPVPITLQVLFVLLAGIVLGERYGILSVLFYTGAGVVGLPVFAGAAGGMAIFIGPTGGYIVGFLIAPLLIASIMKKLGRGVPSAFLAMLVGLSVIYLFGAIHLSVFLGTGFVGAVKLGVVPFIAADFMKIIIAIVFIHTTRGKDWIS